jgi:mRNA-degrading endonuclease RelE of RelBE toxin-antitoxin system
MAVMRNREIYQLSFLLWKLLKFKYAIDDKESMLFIETSIFTKQIKDLVSDEEYRQLQQDLLVQPDRGDLIKNGGGIRKVRCAQGNKGKSGGIRVIYYWVTEDDQIFFLVAYPKSVKDNLTDKETAILHQLVKEQFHG